jgi:hypothetical protein
MDRRRPNPRLQVHDRIAQGRSHNVISDWPWYIREQEYNAEVSSHRAPVERAVAQLKTWRILFTDYRRPLKTFQDSFNAAIGLYFFKLTFA